MVLQIPLARTYSRAPALDSNYPATRAHRTHIGTPQYHTTHRNTAIDPLPSSSNEALPPAPLLTFLRPHAGQLRPRPRPPLAPHLATVLRLSPAPSLTPCPVPSSSPWSSALLAGSLGHRRPGSIASWICRGEDEGDPAHPGRAVREPDWGQVLGGDLRPARDRHHGPLRGGLGPAARADQRLLQRGQRREVRAARRHHGPRAGHHGLRARGPLQPDLPPRQLRLRPVRRREQLGQGPLQRRAHRLRHGRRAQRGRELRLPPGMGGWLLDGEAPMHSINKGVFGRSGLPRKQSTRIRADPS